MKALWKTLFYFGSGLGDNNYLSIFIYHRVLDRKDPLRLSTVDASEFSEQMEWIKNHFVVLPLYEAVDLIKQRRLPRRAASITFDDGYVDNLTVASPILKSYGMPASFYVSSKLIGSRAMWNDRIIESVRQTSVDVLELAGKTFDIKSVLGKQVFLEFFEDHYKSLPLVEADRLLEGLISEMGELPHEPLFMNEKQIRELSSNRMEIGSHGQHHKILSAIPAAQAEVEITQSKKDIEKIIDREVKGFAYPNGKAPIDFSKAHGAMVTNAGYQYALSTNYGCSQGRDELFNLKRFTPWKPTKAAFLSSMFLNYWYYQERV